MFLKNSITSKVMLAQSKDLRGKLCKWDIHEQYFGRDSIHTLRGSRSPTYKNYKYLNKLI